jgi:hypothetical protein
VSDFVFNIAKGKFGYYGGLPATSDALIVVPIEATGLETDSTLKDYDTLATLLAGASNEQTTIGRKTAASVTWTVTDASDIATLDIADLTWTAATGNALGALVVCYSGDTGTDTDANLIPISKHAFAVTPDGSDLTAQIDTAGIAVAQDA